MTDREAPADEPPTDKNQPILEVVALLLYAALHTETRQPLRAGRSHLALRLFLVHRDARNRLPVGHKPSPEGIRATRPYTKQVDNIKDPDARVVRLLEGAGEILADMPAHAMSSDLAAKVSDLLKEAKAAPSY